MTDKPHVDYRLFDADNHYYEAEDAFTRHIEKPFAKRAVQWATINGKPKILVGGTVSQFIPNPTFDPVARPGVLTEYFKGRTDASVSDLFGELEPIRPEYRDRDVRLKVMDEQGIEGVWLFPTLGVGIEVALRHDVPACVAAFRAFNRWLEEDWGFAYRERIFAAPYITLVDVDAAVAELEWCLAHDLRLLCMVPTPVARNGTSISPFMEEFDPFWSRVNEAGVTVAIHSGDSGYGRYVEQWEPHTDFRAFFMSPLERVMVSDRPICDTVAALLCHKLFDRHPKIRMALVENGAGWVKVLLKKVDRAASQTPGWFSERPSDTFRRHVWVSPFWEERPARTAEVIGVDRTIFGSDWPHIEGIAEPASYLDALDTLPDDAVRKIMRDNALGLTTPALSAIA